MELDKNQKEFFSNVEELADLIKSNVELPESDKTICEGLSVGQQYVYYIDDEIYVAGTVMFNDGVTAIIKVTDRYSEAFFEIIYYKELNQIFPFFHDAEAKRLTEYLCLDVETEFNLIWRDPDEDILMERRFDDNGNYKPIPLDPIRFQKERSKKKLILELGK